MTGETVEVTVSAKSYFSFPSIGAHQGHQGRILPPQPVNRAAVEKETGISVQS